MGLSDVVVDAIVCETTPIRTTGCNADLTAGLAAILEMKVIVGAGGPSRGTGTSEVIVGAMACVPIVNFLSCV